MANESLYGNIATITPKNYKAINEDLLPPERVTKITVTQSIDGKFVYVSWQKPMVNAPSDPYLDDRYPESEVNEYPLLDPLPLRDLGGFYIYRTTMLPEAWMGRFGNLNNLMNSWQNTKPDGYGNTLANNTLDFYHPPAFERVAHLKIEDIPDTEGYITFKDGVYTWMDTLVKIGITYYYTVTAFDKTKGLKEVGDVGTRPFGVDMGVHRWPYY